MIFSRIADALFPPRCCGCDEITDTKLPVCTKCAEKLIHPEQKRVQCPSCMLSKENCICAKNQYFDKISACFYYEGMQKKSVFKLKFRARRDLAKSFSKTMYLSLNERNMLENIDIITFVPMHPVNKFLRGYNQSELIAKYLSQYSGIPCKALLKKETRTSSQHNLGHVRRSGNLIGVFEPIEDTEPQIKGKRILAVDDVMTTGSTLNEIAKTLLIFGAESVFVSCCTVTKNSKNSVEQKKKL